MRSLSDYLTLIPPLNAGDANFMAEVALVLAPFADIQAFLAALPAAFDLDTAIGVQLDATGAWIGQSREVPVPIENPWFSLDVAGLGLDQGYLWGPYEGLGLVSLDDDTYRRLLRAKIVANNCNGTFSAVLACLTTYFTDPATKLFVIDATDYPPGATSINIAIQVGLSGVIPNIVDLSILAQNLIPFAPAACEIIWGITTVNNTPVFGLDLENQYIAGLDVGALGASPNFVASMIG